MTYRHHSLRCHHRVQNTQGSNEHQLRITCQECQGHLAIVYGRHLNEESRRLLRKYLYETPVPAAEAQPPPAEAQPPPAAVGIAVAHADDLLISMPVQRPTAARARAAAAMQEPQDEPEPAAREEDIEVSRARILLKITELNQEARRLTAELEALPRQATPPQAQNPPEANPEEMSRAQGSPRELRPHP